MAIMEKRYLAESNHPVFIGGTQRSGTSIFRALIDSNSAIYFPRAEMKFFVRFYHRLKDYEPIRKKENLERFIRDYGSYRKNIKRSGLLDSSEFFDVLYSRNASWKNIFHIIMAELALMENKYRWGEKSPGNEYFTGQILDFFPGAKVICTIRDPRAVIASSRRKYGRGFIKPLLRWKMAVRKILYDFNEIPPTSFQVVFYEDLVLDLENTMKQVFDFLETEPLYPMDGLQINSEKWGHGGRTSYPEKGSSKEGIVWKHTLHAYKNELSDVEIKTIMAFTRKERKSISYHRKEPKEYNYTNSHARSSQRSFHGNLGYNPVISHILNQHTDKPLIT